MESLKHWPQEEHFSWSSKALGKAHCYRKAVGVGVESSLSGLLIPPILKTQDATYGRLFYRGSSWYRRPILKSLSFKLTMRSRSHNLTSVVLLSEERCLH